MIYQIENDKNSADIVEKGLIIAFDGGNISAGDMVLGSDNKYVVSVPSTEEGKFRYSRLLCYDYECW